VHCRKRRERPLRGCDELHESGRELQPRAAEGAKRGRVRRIGVTADESAVRQRVKDGARDSLEHQVTVRVIDLAP